MFTPLRVYFTLAFALTWGIGGIGLLMGHWIPGTHPFSPSSPLYYLAGYSVSLSGIVLTAWYEGRNGLRRLGQRLIPWRSAASWYLLVVIGYAAITGLAWQTAKLFAGTSGGVANWPLFFSGILLSVARDPGPIGEEFGWRGFALPKLLEVHSPLKSSLILGLIHAAWHVPLFFIPGMPQGQRSFVIFALGTVSMAIFDGALYLRTGANVLLAILVHLMANDCGGFIVGVLGEAAFPFFVAAQPVFASLIVIVGGLRSTGARTLPARNAASG